RVRLDRAPDRCAPLRISELRRGMTAGPSPFAGLRVVLVAAFNRRYHRSGLALAAALAAFGCEVRRCEERRRGWNAVFGRSLVARLTARLRRGPVDVVLVFKGAGLAPADVADLRRRFGGRWVNWFPDDPHQLELSSRLAPAHDCFFTHDSASLAGHRAPDGEIVLYRSVAELADRARVLLGDETLRRRLAAAARERALREHTWRHRVEELLTITLR